MFPVFPPYFPFISSSQWPCCWAENSLWRFSFMKRNNVSSELLWCIFTRRRPHCRRPAPALWLAGWAVRHDWDLLFCQKGKRERLRIERDEKRAETEAKPNSEAQQLSDSLRLNSFSPFASVNFSTFIWQRDFHHVAGEKRHSAFLQVLFKDTFQR